MEKQEFSGFTGRYVPDYFLAVTSNFLEFHLVS